MAGLAPNLHRSYVIEIIEKIISKYLIDESETNLKVLTK
jgi:hypothetical protein